MSEQSSRTSVTKDQLAQAQKPKAGTPAYSRFVNRPLGKRLATTAFRLGRTPNQVSCASGLCSLIGLALVAFGPQRWWLGLVVAAVLAFAYALDSADGQLARLRGGGSPVGEYLDHMIDAAKTVLLHISVLVWTDRVLVGDRDWPRTSYLVPLGYLLVAVVMFFGLLLVDQLKRRAPADALPANPRGTSVLAALIILPTDYGIICVIFVALGWPAVFFALYALLALANAVFLLAALVKWQRDLNRVGQALTAEKAAVQEAAAADPQAADAGPTP